MAYTEAEKISLVEQVCNLIVDTGVANACKQVGVAENTFFRWLASDDSLWQYYARAREAMAIKGESDLDQINKDIRSAVIDAQQARVIAVNTKWLMARRSPRKYGETSKVQIGGDPQGAPIQINVTKEEDKKRLEAL